MAEFPADATVDTAAPAEPMQLAQIEEKKPAEFKGFFEHGTGVVCQRYSYFVLSVDKHFSWYDTKFKCCHLFV